MAITEGIVIANHREVFASIDSKQDANVRKKWRETGFDVCLQGTFWGGDNKLVILPVEPSSWFVSHVTNTLQLKNTEFLSPKHATDSICDDILVDERILDALRAKAGTCSSSVPHVNLYSATHESYQLRSALDDRGIHLYWPEHPVSSSVWTISHFGSKAGSRALFYELLTKDKETTIRFPRGYICDNLSEMLDTVLGFAAEGTDCVIKGNRGISGFENLYVPAKEVCLRREGLLSAVTSSVGQWSSRSYVVEQKVSTDSGVLFTYPSIDAVIGKDGETIAKGITLMRISPTGKFEGLIQDNRLIPVDIRATIEYFNITLGSILSSHGYRGHYDIDFVLSEDRVLFVTEVNLRRTGGSHVLDIKRMLSLTNRCLLSVGRYSHPHLETTNLTCFYRAADSCSYDPSTQTGLVFVSPRALEEGRATISFIAIGYDLDHARLLIEEFIRLLTCG